MKKIENNRLAEARKIIRRKNLTALLITDSVSAAYISGFSASHCMLVITLRSNIILTDFRYKQKAEKFVARANWKLLLITTSEGEAVSPLFKKKSRVGIDSETITVDRFDQFKKKCNDVSFVKMKNTLSPLWIQKSKIEIRQMQKAAKIGDIAYIEWITKLRIGMSEFEAARILEGICADNGSQKPSFNTIVLFGSNSALPHGVPSQRKLRNGDWVLSDFGCVVNGFCSDMTRTAVFGSSSAKQREIYGIVLEAQEKAKRAVIEGAESAKIDSFAREHISNAGYGDKFGHGTGHGVGLHIHESPRVSSKDLTVLSENMVITIEPGIYLPSFGGVRIEDMGVVTKKGFKTLTNTSRAFLEITQ